jgi:hypothetical protein
VIGVLGNHDYEADEHVAIREALVGENVHILDGESVVVKDVGFAGVKGFGGGFDRYMMPMFGEPMFKQFVQECVDEALRLDRALARLDNENAEMKKIVVLHYSPIKATVEGEPRPSCPSWAPRGWWNRSTAGRWWRPFHGHAHYGTLEGETSAGVKIFNVSKPILQRAGYETPFYLAGSVGIVVVNYDINWVVTDIVDHCDAADCPTHRNSTS